MEKIAGQWRALAVLTLLAVGAAFSPMGAQAADAPYATAVYGNTPPSGTTPTTNHHKIAPGQTAQSRKAIAAGGVPYNHAYFMVPHNSYEFDPDSTSSSGLKALLNDGFRVLEIDIYNRSGTGDDYVAHYFPINDNHCEGDNRGFDDCIKDIKAWLDSNNNDWPGPITVWIDTKGASSDWTKVDHHQTAYNIVRIFGDRVVTPREIRDWARGQPGVSPTASLRQAVGSKGWPNMNLMDNDRNTGGSTDYGDVIFILTGNTNALDDYAGWLESNIPLFVCPRVDDVDDFRRGSNPTGFSRAEAEWVVCGNFQWGDHRQQMMNESYNNNFISHVWEGSGGYAETETFAHSYISVAHGAQFISRDHSASTFGNHLPYAGVRRSVPGYFKLKNSMAGNCLDVAGKLTGNGTKLVLWTCYNWNNQNFVYTMEGQLRPRHATTKCVDVEGGDASGEWRDIHIWDCDGGRSEKWELQYDNAKFLNYEDTNYGFGTGGSNAGKKGVKLWTRSRSNLNWAGQFVLEAVADWGTSGINW